MLYLVDPFLFPGLPDAPRHTGSCLMFVPIALSFTVAIVCSNVAYEHCCAVFVQYVKQGRIPTRFLMLSIVGFQKVTLARITVVALILTGQATAVSGEMKF